MTNVRLTTLDPVAVTGPAITAESPEAMVQVVFAGTVWEPL